MKNSLLKLCIGGLFLSGLFFVLPSHSLAATKSCTYTGTDYICAPIPPSGSNCALNFQGPLTQHCSTIPNGYTENVKGFASRSGGCVQASNGDYFCYPVPSSLPTGCKVVGKDLECTTAPNNYACAIDGNTCLPIGATTQPNPSQSTSSTNQNNTTQQPVATSINSLQCQHVSSSASSDALQCTFPIGATVPNNCGRLFSGGALGSGIGGTEAPYITCPTNPPGYRCTGTGSNVTCALVSSENTGSVTPPPTAPAAPANPNCPNAKQGDICYTPLEPIPGVTLGGTELDLPNVLKRLFQILFSVGALLAVVMLVIGGIQYMVSPVLETKNIARERLSSAALGLLILAGSYLILYTINPELVSLRFLGSSSNTGPTPIIQNTSLNSITANQLTDKTGDSLLFTKTYGAGFEFYNGQETTKTVMDKIIGFTKECKVDRLGELKITSLRYGYTSYYCAGSY